MKLKLLFALTCSACCLALFSSCAGLGAGVVRNYKNKTAADEVRGLVSIGDDIHATAEKLREAGWHAPGPTPLSDQEGTLRCLVRVGKHSFFDVMQEVCGHSLADGVSPYVFIYASADGKITSVE